METKTTTESEPAFFIFFSTLTACEVVASQAHTRYLGRRAASILSRLKAPIIGVP